MISVVIPSYRNPSYLDLCLKSATENQVNKNQIIVVLDGYAEESSHVIKKYPGIEVLVFEENKGQMVAHNTGVTLSSGEWILIVNDDNVFPLEWDERLRKGQLKNTVQCPNQIEPSPSIFPSFHIHNFGKSVQDFQYTEFLEWESKLSHLFKSKGDFSYDGQTFPLFMEKRWFQSLNGFDQSFPHAPYADWDFFMRAEMLGLACIRNKKVNFYHFAGAATKTKDETWNNKEYESFQYFSYKWGWNPQRNALNSLLQEQTSRGITFSAKRQCSRCKERKHYSNFSFSQNTRSGFHSICKNCKNLQAADEPDDE